MTGARVDCNALAAVYGDGADAYDAIWSPVIRPAAATVIAALELDGTSRILDVGAGTGGLTAALTVAAPHAFVVSVDASPQMLRYARSHRHAVAALADATRLPFPSDSVDAVLLAYVLFHLLDPAAGLREAVRVLHPTGRAGTVTWASETPSRAALVWDQALEELGVPALPAHGNHRGLETEAAIDALLLTTGLRPTRTWRETIEHTFEPERFWQMRITSGSNRQRLAGLDAATRNRVLPEIQRRLARLDARDYAFQGELICAVGEKIL